MADPQIEDQSTPSSSTDIATLAGGPPKGLIEKLTQAQGARTAEDFDITRQADERLNRDQAVIDRAYKAEGVSMGKLNEIPAWDADKEKRKYERDPIEGFGSLGGLFAMVASAFTKAPMENAINGMAGAINSLREGDEKAYERAHESWKENTKLALERFHTQRELYQDALGLMDHDQAAATAKLRNSAVRFGDTKALMLIEAGMFPEFYELQEAQAKAAATVQQSLDNTTDATLRRKAYEAGVKGMEPSGNPQLDAAKKLQLWTSTHGTDVKSPQMAILGQYMNEHPNATADEIAAFADKHGIIRQYGTSGSLTTDKLTAQKIVERAQGYVDGGMDANEAFDRAGKEIKAALAKPVPEKLPTLSNVQAKGLTDIMNKKINEGMDPEQAFLEASKETAAAIAKPSASGASSLTEARAINRDAEEHQAQMKKEHPDWTKEQLEEDRDEYSRRRKMASGALTPSKIAEYQAKLNQTDNIIKGSEQNLAFLKKYAGGAGLMGKIMRGEEIASNILSAGHITNSERVAFRRRVLELQEIVPQILTDRMGRPLKSDQEKIDGIVAGLARGDTGPNTIKAYKDLIADIKKRQQDYRGIIEHGYDPTRKSSGSEPGSAVDPDSAASPSTDWLKHYPSKPVPEQRSDNEVTPSTLGTLGVRG